MIAYETLMLAPTEITNDELMSIENHFDQVLSKHKGSLISFDKWGKFQLAFPVKKNSYGIYTLARYEMPQEACSIIIKEFTTFFKIKCADFIMRHINVRLEKSASGEYPRPEAIDTQRTSSLGILKEKKIEHLLDSVDSSTKKKAEAAKKEASTTPVAKPAPEQATPEKQATVESEKVEKTAPKAK